MKKLLFTLFAAAMMLAMCMTSFASTTFSDNWYAVGDTWRISGNAGDVVNAWVCDDAVAANGQNVWYLIDRNGNMYSAGLVQDNTGNYYSLETNHNGYYGMLRYKSGNYDGIYLELEPSHNGAFGAIRNADGIAALKAKYGLVHLDIDNNNIVYTSQNREPVNYGTDVSTGGSSAGQKTSSGNVPAYIAAVLTGNGEVDWDVARDKYSTKVQDLGLAAYDRQCEEIMNIYRYSLGKAPIVRDKAVEAHLKELAVRSFTEPSSWAGVPEFGFVSEQIAKEGYSYAAEMKAHSCNDLTPYDFAYSLWSGTLMTDRMAFYAWEHRYYDGAYSYLHYAYLPL